MTVHEEPMHRLVYDEGDLRVLDVEIPPGATTLYHTHDAAIAYVPIDTSPTDNQVLGGEWEGNKSTDPPRFSVGIVTWNLGYASTPLTHRVKNVGDGNFRLIAVVNYSPGSNREVPAHVLGGEVEQACRWFRWRQITLTPGERLDGTTGANRIVAVQIDPGRVSVTSRTTATLVRPGDFIVLDTNGRFTLESSSPESIDLCAVEVATPTRTPANRSRTSRPVSER